MINLIKILLETGYVMNKYCWTWKIPYSKDIITEKKLRWNGHVVIRKQITSPIYQTYKNYFSKGQTWGGQPKWWNGIICQEKSLSLQHNSTPLIILLRSNACILREQGAVLLNWTFKSSKSSQNPSFFRHKNNLFK